MRYENTSHTIEIVSPSLSYRDPVFVGFTESLGSLHTIAPIRVLTLLPTTANKWDLHIILVDNREWM